MRFFLPAFLSALLACQVAGNPNSNHEKMDQKRLEYVLVIHGGAGAIRKEFMTPEKESAYRAGLQAALDAGSEILAKGGSSLDAVEASIRVLEDDLNFNAGKGAVFTNTGHVELDASFMDGKTLNAGAVAGVTKVKHPVSAARLVLGNSPHVMLSGSGADQFAQEKGLEIVENGYFHTERRLNQLKKVKGEKDGTGLRLSEDMADKKFGTVGAVALDKGGNLAAATSTGGMTNKRYGRIGDSPIIGAGTYANNATCAVSCTGHGEYFIRYAVAYDLHARMAYQGISLEEAATQIIDKDLVEVGGEGGLIAVDRNGNMAMPFNSAGMFRGFVTADGRSEIAIYKD